MGVATLHQAGRARMADESHDSSGMLPAPRGGLRSALRAAGPAKASSPMRSDEIHPGDLIAGKYRVRTILGRKHGLLVEGFHTEFDQRVVIKILLPGYGEEKEIERFRREARTLSKLESEHAARIIDVGTQPDGSFYLVRQFLEGSDLDQHGYLTDIVEVDNHLDEIVSYYQEQMLNDKPEFAGLNPSIEHFARILAASLSERIGAQNITALKVVLWENDAAWAAYRVER